MGGVHQIGRQTSDQAKRNQTPPIVSTLVVVVVGVVVGAVFVVVV